MPETRLVGGTDWQNNTTSFPLDCARLSDEELSRFLTKNQLFQLYFSMLCCFSFSSLHKVLFPLGIQFSFCFVQDIKPASLWQYHILRSIYENSFQDTRIETWECSFHSQALTVTNCSTELRELILTLHQSMGNVFFPGHFQVKVVNKPISSTQRWFIGRTKPHRKTINTTRNMSAETVFQSVSQFKT